MNMNKISAGYRFTFNSNDIFNENPNTMIKEGLTENEVSFFVELSDVIQGGTYLQVRSNTPEWRIKKEHEKLYNVLEKYSNLFNEEDMAKFKEDVGVIMDYIAENMIGYSGDDNIDMRVLKNYKIENIPQDIIINDVTNQFSKKNKM